MSKKIRRDKPPDCRECGKPTVLVKRVSGDWFQWRCKPCGQDVYAVPETRGRAQ